LDHEPAPSFDLTPGGEGRPHAPGYRTAGRQHAGGAEKYLQEQPGFANLPLAFTLNGKNLTDSRAPLPDDAQITVLVAMGMP